MTTRYPLQIDTSLTLPTVIDNVTPISANVINRLRDAILATQGELGVKPAGIYANVRNRLDYLEFLITTISTNGTNVIFNGDLSGNTLSQSVIALRGNPVSNQTLNASQDGYVFTWLNSLNQWKAQPTVSAFIPAGDLSGSSSSQNVIKIQNIAVSNTVPLSNNALVFDGVSWLPTQLTLDPELIGAAFAISLSGGSLLEVGDTIATPAFTATKNYNGTSAILTNNDNAESKNVLTEFNAVTPFTSAFSYIKSTYNSSVTFTLTANKGAIVRVAQTSFTWVQKVFWGVGSAGGNSEVFIEALSNNALATSRSRTFAVIAGATEKIYYAYRTAFGAATFFVGGFEGGFTLVSTTISVTNSFGFNENYTLYESDNLNLGTTTVTVT